MFCKDCIHCKPATFSFSDYYDQLKFAKCARFPNEESKLTYAVTGIIPDDDFMYCSTARIYDCGIEAKFFQAQEKLCGE